MTEQLARLRRQQADHRATLSNEQSMCHSIEAQIARLETAKNEISACKDDLQQDQRSFENRVDTGDWSGQLYKDFESSYADCLVKVDTYERAVDDFLDDICDEITRLENSANDSRGAIGWLQNQLNSLANEIEKLLN